MTTRIAYYTMLLESKKWPVTLNGLQALVAVSTGEGDVCGAYNPINTILYKPGATAFNTFGPNGEYHVWNYPDLATGLEAVGQTIGAWPSVADAFSSGASALYILECYQASDGVGGNLYVDCLPEVQATWPAYGNVIVSGSGNDPNPPPPPPPQGTDMKLVFAKGGAIGKLGANSWWLVGVDESGPFAWHIKTEAEVKIWEAILGPGESVSTSQFALVVHNLIVS